jgi:hypothetical protein
MKWRLRISKNGKDWETYKEPSMDKQEIEDLQHHVFKNTMWMYYIQELRGDVWTPGDLED